MVLESRGDATRQGFDRTRKAYNWEALMLRRTLTLFAFVALTAASADSQKPDGEKQKFGAALVVPLKKFSPIHRFETLSGDPAKSGLYVIRIHAEAGYVSMPHSHPQDENIAVLQGSWAAGMGEHFNQESLETMEAGSYALLPKKMAHFAFSKTDTILQVHGLGPFTPRYVVPNYDLNDKGTFLRTS